MEIIFVLFAIGVSSPFGIKVVENYKKKKSKPMVQIEALKPKQRDPFEKPFMEMFDEAMEYLLLEEKIRRYRPRFKGDHSQVVTSAKLLFEEWRRSNEWFDIPYSEREFTRNPHSVSDAMDRISHVSDSYDLYEMYKDRYTIEKKGNPLLDIINKSEVHLYDITAAKVTLQLAKGK